MGLWQELATTYDRVISCDLSNETHPLMPVGFIAKSVKYIIALTPDGDLSSVAERSGEVMRIPSTSEAESRTTSDGAPFPLVEQLKYMVCINGDSRCLDSYLAQLEAWMQTPGAPAYLSVVVKYIKKNTILDDISRYCPKFKYSADEKSMVGFYIQGVGELCAQADLQQSWSEYVSRTQSGPVELCYIEGRKLPSRDKHPKLQGNAKLISSKDNAYPFQYKGRFVKDGSSAVISYEASTKAHNTLVWLAKRQGLQRYGMTWVVWDTNGARMSPPIEPDDDDFGNITLNVIDTFEAYAIAVRDAALGYENRMKIYNAKRASEAVILGMMAATDGRMSIVYYQQMPGNRYVDNLRSWYESCCWWIYNYNSKTVQIGTPRIKELARAILGNVTVDTADADKRGDKPASKLMRELQTRFMACIMDRQPVPVSMIQSGFNRSCVPLAFTVGNKDQKWSRSKWTGCVRAACALIFKFQNDQSGDACVFGPELCESSNDRSYLYGRLLAVADKLESDIKYRKGDDNSLTNAIRIFSRFAQRPFDSWRHLHEQLIPYLGKSEINSGWYQKLIGDIECLFNPEERGLTGPLGWSFIQGFSSQNQALYSKKSTEAVAADPAETQGHISEMPKGRSEMYGCLIGIADVLELVVSGFENSGSTNALRLMRMFAARPCETWALLHDKLIPYIEQLEKDEHGRKQSSYYKNLLGQVEKRFTWAERASSEPLDGSYLHGYYLMRKTLLTAGWTVARDDLNNAPADEVICRETLFGKLLGIADREEYLGQKLAMTDDRPTNALRLLAAMRQKPASVWPYLKNKLAPYQKRIISGICRQSPCASDTSPYNPDDLSRMRDSFSRKTENHRMSDNLRIRDIELKLEENGWMTNEPLRGTYLHSYYIERNFK